MQRPPVRQRLQHAWNAFRSREPTESNWWNPGTGQGAGNRPDRPRRRRGNEQSIVTAIYNRIAMDVAAINIQHVRNDDEGQYVEVIDSGLNETITLSANIDQPGRAFFQDVVMSMFDEGVVAIVPVDTTMDPNMTNAYDVQSIRTGKILQWWPDRVRLEVYNDHSGRREEIILPKTMVAIVENPFYAVMNAPNSTLNRLIRKLNILDAIDEQSGSGKLDILVQLPFSIKTPQRRAEAEKRRKDIEMQLAGSKYGIGYIDATERVTQLNRPAENNLMNQIEYLTRMLYSQLGTTEDVFNGTADEAAKLNYYNDTIEPILSAIVDEMKRKFLTKTARTRNQSIMFFRDPFKLVPVSQIAEIADKFTRNEILTSNEFRSIIGYKPSKDPRADELRNANLNASNDQLPPQPTKAAETE